MEQERLRWAGPVTNCPERTWPEPTFHPTHDCERCGMIHDANGGLLMGPCPSVGCAYVSKPGGAVHDGPCYVPVAA